MLTRTNRLLKNHTVDNTAAATAADDDDDDDDDDADHRTCVIRTARSVRDVVLSPYLVKLVLGRRQTSSSARQIEV